MNKIIAFSFLLLVNSKLSAECFDNIPRTSGSFDSTQFSGEVVDSSTGLAWFRCQHGQTLEDDNCIGEPTTANWQTIMKHAENFSHNDHTNWRLPNIKELQSIVEYSCNNPKLDTKAFPIDNVSTYWSSTPEMVDQANQADRAYILSIFGTTRSDNKHETFNALLVRDLE